MSAFYSKMAQTAVRLLTKFGTDAILTKGGVSVRDKVAGTVTKSGYSVHTVKAVITEYNTKLIDGQTILQGDRKIILDPRIKPEVGDSVNVAGSTWNIVHVQVSEPAGIPLTYTLQVRK